MTLIYANYDLKVKFLYCSIFIAIQISVKILKIRITYIKIKPPENVLSKFHNASSYYIWDKL